MFVDDLIHRLAGSRHPPTRRLIVRSIRIMGSHQGIEELAEAKGGPPVGPTPATGPAPATKPPAAKPPAIKAPPAKARGSVAKTPEAAPKAGAAQGAANRPAAAGDPPVPPKSGQVPKPPAGPPPTSAIVDNEMTYLRFPAIVANI